ncbi:MAG: sigma-70 family RNA polymerase sigma factor [Methylibium sp.]|nr:sigma-70 family RNA polymerase sigma factor [Methylibium sp.]
MSSAHQPSAPADAPASLLGSFNDHYAALLRFLSRRAGNREDVHELAHDTWLRIAQAQAAVAPRTLPSAIDHPRAYLFAVAANLVLDRQRRDQRTKQWIVPGDFRDDDAPQARPSLLTPDVADGHAHRQALLAIDQALQEIPERARACFLSHRLDGIGQDELAQRHGVSLKTVERDMKIAKDQVRATMERWHGVPVVPNDLQGTPRNRRKALSALLGLVGVGCGATLGWQAWREARAGFGTTLATLVGKRLEQTLPDGSHVTLDADSRAEIAFDASRRRVRLLRGSAFFAVAREDGGLGRVFAVEAQGALITVLGTRFGVEIDGADVLVAVEEGRVGVRSADGQERVLEAGELARLGKRIDVRTAGAPTEIAAWRHGWLDFERLPLAEAVARLARYSRRSLHVSPDAAGLVVLARVRLAKTAEWLELLPRHLPVRLDNQEDGSLLIRRR